MAASATFALKAGVCSGAVVLSWCLLRAGFGTCRLGLITDGLPPRSPGELGFPRDRPESASVPWLNGTRGAVISLAEGVEGTVGRIFPSRLWQQKWCFP